MKRLTVRDSSGIVVIDCKSCCGVLDASQEVSAICDCEDCLRESTNRLAAIENILGDDYDLDRLKELVQANREGKCVVLPCRVGDKVYCIQSYFNDAKMRSEKKVKCRVVDFMQSLPDLFECEGMIYKFSDIGKIVFLTCEEAEAALEKMKERDK